MNKLEHQKELLEYYSDSNVELVSDILTKNEFLKVCEGDGYSNWDDNYFCIIEQEVGELTK